MNANRATSESRDSCVLLMDGAMGTELIARGVPCDESQTWSASANHENGSLVADIHRAYAAAGATLHTANTFRTQRRWVGAERWLSWTRRAIELAKSSVPESHRVAGSLPPLCDCYRPDLSPKGPRPEQREFAAVLRTAGCDLILCETHCHPGEAISAVEEAVATGCETWLSLTAGPNADLLIERQLVLIASQAVDRGAAAVLVNCTPAAATLRYVRALADENLGVPFGAYANAGGAADGLGWHSGSRQSTQRYVSFAESWIDAGATVVGGCCGIGPATISALRDALDSVESR